MSYGHLNASQSVKFCRSLVSSLYGQLNRIKNIPQNISVARVTMEASNSALADMTPSQLRDVFRLGQHFRKLTSGMCDGYLQCNIAMVDASLAKDFKKFCDLNHAALPLMYMSKVGQYAAPPLAESSDIRYYLVIIALITVSYRFFMYSSKQC